jgi:hypothetical protein
MSEEQALVEEKKYTGHFPAQLKKDLKEATKHSLEHIEDKTSILPHVVGRTVAEKRGLKGPEVEKFAQHVADRTVHLYNHNPTFKKKLHGAGDKGRDHLYAFANHWLDAKSHLKESEHSATFNTVKRVLRGE